MNDSSALENTGEMIGAPTGGALITINSDSVTFSGYVLLRTICLG